MKLLLAAVNAKYIHSNLAVYSMKAYCRAFAEHIELAEYTINQQEDEILKDLYRKKPEILCFSCYIWNISFIKELIRNVKKILPDTVIWAGGPEVSYDAEQFLEEMPEVFGVMCGEGEETFRELTQYYVNLERNTEKGTELEKIDGIVFRKGKEIQKTAPRAILDMDTLVFPYQDMELFHHRIIYYESSRGCPFSCSYCLSSIDKKLRFRSTKLVKQELQFFLDNQVPQVKFVDRTFNCKKEHALEIWRYIQEHDNQVTNFHFEIAADLLTEEEIALIHTMRPGLIQLEIGVQSTNPDTLSAIRRKTDIAEIRKITHHINSRHNIHQHLDLIAGLPHEDLSSFRKSFNEVYDMEPEQLQLGFLKVLKGSYMEEMIPACELLYSSSPPYEVLSTRWLSYGDILELKAVEEMVEVYYNSRQFTCTLEQLRQEFDTPYEMFLDLAGFYQKKGYGGVNHSRLARYEILWEQAEEMFSDGSRTDAERKREQYRDALMTDLYLRENIKSRPSFARNLSHFKEQIRRFFRQEEDCPCLLPDYTGYDSRQLAKMAHLEPAGDGSFLLFDYKNRDPLTYNARMVRVEIE